MSKTIRNVGHPANDGKCSSCGHDEFTIGEGRNVRGDPTYPFVCDRCGYVEAQYAKRKDAMAYAQDHGPLRRVITTTERGVARGKIAPSHAMTEPCAVCGATGDSQEHHWAPWHLFGDEAERWPTSWLCQKCHTRWHQIVTPNMGKKP
jgi:DNA-directed RNA polymerase subunit M/transcription elongation factor TFIIS